MSIYNDGKTNNNPIATNFTLKNSAMQEKRKANKEKLVNKVFDMITDDLYGYKDLVNEFLYNGLKKMTQKDLKTWLN